jgi:hypothetical protein
MRINTDLLLKIARDHVKSQTRGVHDIVAVYVQGTLLEEEPLIGGGGDIDLVMIRDRAMAEDERQIVRVTDDIHLDIVHTPREKYRQPRDLRVHPWLGPCIYHCNIIFDPQHFMDFVQASVRGQFERTDNIALRSHRLLDKARESWLTLQDLGPGQPQDIWRYLRAVENASNALVVLTGSPLTERRFLIRFPEYATAVGRPGLAAALQGLIGASHCNLGLVMDWIEEWQKAFDSLPAEKAHGYLDPLRVNYYLRFFETHLGTEAFYQANLWPLLNIWTATVDALQADSAARVGWRGMVQQLNLVNGGFENRVEALDTYIDTAEEILEEWSRVYGA